MIPQNSQCVSEDSPAGSKAGNPCITFRQERVISTVRHFADRIYKAIEAHQISNDLFMELKFAAEMLQQKYSLADTTAILDALEKQHIPQMLPKSVAFLETELEKTEAVRQLGTMKTEDGFLASFILFDKYKNLVRKEWMLLQHLYSHVQLCAMKFAFVGCGAMPLTAIGLAERFGVSVDCFDTDPEVCKLAADLAARTPQAKVVRIMRQNGLEIDYSLYDVVFVANLVQPRSAVLKRIAGFNNVKALMTRRVRGLVSLMYSSLDEQALADLGLMFKAESDPNDRTSIHQSILLTHI